MRTQRPQSSDSSVTSMRGQMFACRLPASSTNCSAERQFCDDERTRPSSAGGRRRVVFDRRRRISSPVPRDRDRPGRFYGRPQTAESEGPDDGTGRDYRRAFATVVEAATKLFTTLARTRRQRLYINAAQPDGAPVCSARRAGKRPQQSLTTIQFLSSLHQFAHRTLVGFVADRMRYAVFTIGCNAEWEID